MLTGYPDEATTRIGSRNPHARSNVDGHTIRVDSRGPQLVGEEAAQLRGVAAELPGITRGLNGRGILRQPSFQCRSELED